eukprot:9296211-Lingulodinium_polyedra.AAC.1
MSTLISFFTFFGGCASSSSEADGLFGGARDALGTDAAEELAGSPLPAVVASATVSPLLTDDSW